MTLLPNAPNDLNNLRCGHNYHPLQCPMQYCKVRDLAVREAADTGKVYANGKMRCPQCNSPYHEPSYHL